MLDQFEQNKKNDNDGQYAGKTQINSLGQAFLMLLSCAFWLTMVINRISPAFNVP